MPTGLGDEQLWLCPSLDNATPFNDLSSQGNNGTAVGGLTTVADTSSGGAYAYDFDGSNDYIDTGSTTVHQNTLFTYSFWINASASLSSITGAVGSYEKIGDNRGPLACSISGDGRLSWLYMSLGNTYNSAQQLKSVGNVYDSTWHHVVCEFDGNNNEAKIYIDGTLNTSTASSVPNTVNISTSLKFGLGSEGYTTGRMDDVRVYNRALTQSEITHLATARGIEGRPFDGLGDEQLWLCPSLENSPNDLSGNNNNGVYQGGMGTVTDTAEGGSLAYDFDGTNDYINCGNAIAPTTGYSAAAWVNVTSFPSGTNIGTIIAKGYNGTNSTFSFNFRTPTEIRSFTFDGAIHGISNHVHGMSTGTWYHIATTFDGATWKLFINGVEVASVSDSTALSQNNLNTYVGGAFITSSVQRFLDAKLDDVRLFYRALTQSEISWLATERGVLGTPPEGLGGEAHWLCPTLNQTSEITGSASYDIRTNSIVANAESGGEYALDIQDYSTLVFPVNPYSVITDETFSFWVKPLNSTGQRFAWSGVNIKRNAWIAAANTSTGTATAPNGMLTYSDVGVGSWLHMCWVKSGTTQTMYVNGLSVATGPADSLTPDRATNFTGYVGYSTSSDMLFDDYRGYTRALTQSEISWLATERGVLGTPPEGLGDETCWICPTLTQNSTQDITSSGLTITTTGNVSVAADTGAGGTHANFCQGNGTNQAGHEVIIDNFGNTYAEATSVSWWSRRTAGAIVIEMGMNTNLWPTAASGRFYYQRWSSGQDMAYMYNTSGGTNGWIYETGSNATWKHHVMVREGVGGKNRLYINGVLDTEEYDDGGAETTGKDMYFGIGGGGSSDGELYMDDMRTYGRVLTQAEISHLASQRGVLGTPIVGLGDEQLWLCPSIQDSANDLSGNGNNGSYQNGTATVADTDATYGGTRAYFSNAQSQSVLVSNFGDSLNDTTSISMWVKSVNPWVCVPVANGGLGYSTSIWQYALFNSGTSRLLWRRSANLTLSGATPSDQWQHIVIIRDNGSSTQEVYVDGVLNVTSASFTGTYGTNQTWFGFGNAIGTNEELYMDDMRTYGRVLTQAEITHLASQRGVLGSPATTTQYNAFVTHAFRQLFQTRLR